MPYSPSATLPDGDGQALIEYVKSMNLLAEQKDALGRILYLDEQNAVLATYYRNNVLHVFAPAGAGSPASSRATRGSAANSCCASPARSIPTCRRNCSSAGA